MLSRTPRQRQMPNDESENKKGASFLAREKGTAKIAFGDEGEEKDKDKDKDGRGDGHTIGKHTPRMSANGNIF